MKSSLALCSLLLLASALHAEVKLSKVFTPHMVLQRGMAVPVWGTAAPGEKVTVDFAGQSKTATADDKGTWSVKLDALRASAEPRTLMIGSQKIDDVLVGDVWVGSGQSNMDMVVASYIKDDPVLDEAAKQTYPHLRLLRKDANATWEQATPETNPKFSALLFSFGFPLQKELGVPVGLMVGAVGGTPSGFWLSEEMYRSDAASAAAVKAFAPTYKYDELVAKYAVDKAKFDEEFAKWKISADAAKKEGKEAPRPPRGPQPVGKAGETNSGKVGQLFEAFIRPYVGYGIKGVLWDQGESRTNIVGVDQVTLMGALIGGWFIVGSLGFVAAITGLAVVATGSASIVAAHALGRVGLDIQAQYLLVPIAGGIAWVGPDWPEVGDWLGGLAKRWATRRVDGGGS